MLQTLHDDLEREKNITCRFDLSSKLTNEFKIDGDLDRTQSAPNQVSQPSRPSQIIQALNASQTSGISNSSEQFFSICAKVTEEEDKEMVDRWQKDAKVFLIFVSPHVDIYAKLCINWNTIDRTICYRARYAPFLDIPRPESKHSGYIYSLS